MFSSSSTMNRLIVIFAAALIAFASAQGAETFDFEFPDIEKLLERTRIVNGSDANLGQFPHQVSLRHPTRNRHFCGGSIISKRWIVTAAHCSFLDFTPVAVVGAFQLNQGGQVYNIDKIIPHPQYQNQKSLKNDIALWRTTQDIAFDKNVQPIALPTADTPAGAPLTVSGWGRTSYPPPPGTDGIPNQLQFLKTKSLSVLSCKLAFITKPIMYLLVDFNTLVCVRAPYAGSCHGDSGGPLINQDNQLVGVVSWGIPCATGYPDGFTRVYNFRDFIKQTTEASYDD